MNSSSACGRPHLPHVGWVGTGHQRGLSLVVQQGPHPALEYATAAPSGSRNNLGKVPLLGVVPGRVLMFIIGLVAKVDFFCLCAEGCVATSAGRCERSQ